MKTRIKIFLLFVICLPCKIFAQLDIDVKEFTANDGLKPYSQCLRDKQGYTWFLNIDKGIDGLYRFNGREFTSYDFLVGFNTFSYRFGTWRKNRDPLPLIRDREGYVWLGTNKGVFKMKNGQPQQVFNTKNGLASDTIISMAFDLQNNLWIVTARDICIAKNNSGKFEIVKIPTQYSFSVYDEIKICEWKYPGCARAFVDCDSSGFMWWGVSRDNDSSAYLYRSKNYFASGNKIEKFILQDDFLFETLVQGGILLKNTKRRFYFCDSIGKINFLDAKFYDNFIMDDEENFYFSTKPENDFCTFYRDKPKKIVDFGKSASAYIYPQKIPARMNAYHVKDEIWVTDFLNEHPGYILKKNKILNIDSVYPAADLKRILLYETEKGVFWAPKFQKRYATQISVSENSVLTSYAVNSNGAYIAGYNAIDSTFYFSVNEMVGRGMYLYSYKNGMFTLLSKHPIDWGMYFFNHGEWAISSEEGIILHAAPGEKEEVYKIKYKATALDTAGGCFALTDSNKVAYLSHNKITEYPLEVSHQTKTIFSSYSRRFYVRTNDDRIFLYDPLNGKAPVEIQDMPAGKIDTMSEVPSGHIVCFRKGGQTGWLDNGKVNLIDTARFAKYKNTNSFFQDGKDRIFFIGNTSENIINEMLVYEKGEFKIYPLAEPVTKDLIAIPDCNGNTDELIYFSETKIFRYNKQLGKFYMIKNIGQNLGYVWTGLIRGNELFVSGWSPKFFTIDLRKCPVIFPALSFGSIIKDGKELTQQNNYTITYGDNFFINYIAIEKFNQSNIFYQSRIIGADSVWSEPTKNEVKEFTNLPPGKYRFEVRAKGESEIWGDAIAFELTVLPPWYRTTWAYISYVILFFAFTFLTVKLNTRRLQIANQRLQEKINSATSEIRTQKEVIEEKNKNILDSINYAKKIQEAILPSEEEWHKLLTDSFVLFKPRDVVSGDFYWCAEKNNFILFSAADCTGHGVPGALMSMVGSSLYNEAVNEKGITQPALVLNEVRKGIINALKQKGENIQQKDGMDAALCCLDIKNLTLHFSGANNPLWLIRGNEFHEFDGDKFPVGFHYGEIRSFSNHTIELKKGDCIYLFTDGYADQFGGPKGKKFKYKQLKEVLISVSAKQMHEQKIILKDTLENWKGSMEQIDDILIIGVRV